MIRVHWKIDSKMRSSQRSIPSFKWPDWPPLSCCVILQMSRGSHLVPPTVGKLLSRSMAGTLFVYLFFISYCFGETQSNGLHCGVCRHRLCSLLPDNAPPPPASLPHLSGHRVFSSAPSPVLFHHPPPRSVPPLRIPFLVSVLYWVSEYSGVTPPVMATGFLFLLCK